MPSAAIALAPPAERRTQAQRRAATRLRLLDATIDCLTHLGYAGTTTTEVCQRAGVSQGALFKHFPTKAALVSDAAAHLFAQLVDEYHRSFASLADQSDKLGAAIDLLWRIFEQPRLHAAFELYLAARTDPELAATMRPVSAAHRDNLQREARQLFPEAFHHPRFQAFLGIVIETMQGAALGSFTLHDPQRDRAMLDLLKQLARQELHDIAQDPRP